MWQQMESPSLSRLLANSSEPGDDRFTAKAAPGDADYKRKVSQPQMEAIDAMPPAYRELVHDLGYIDVYLAWKNGWSVQKIRDRVTPLGTFKYPQGSW